MSAVTTPHLAQITEPLPCVRHCTKLWEQNKSLPSMAKAKQKTNIHSIITLHTIQTVVTSCGAVGWIPDPVHSRQAPYHRAISLALGDLETMLVCPWVGDPSAPTSGVLELQVYSAIPSWWWQFPSGESVEVERMIHAQGSEKACVRKWPYI